MVGLRDASGRPCADNRARWVAALVLLPVGWLGVCYVGACLLAGTPWPWSSLVHESGELTLLETVLYYPHALRELPLDLLLGIAVGGAARARFGRPVVSPIVSKGAGWTLALTSLLILVGAFVSGGFDAIADNLAQRPTRSQAPLVWGAHWRYHLGERLALLLLAPACVAAWALRFGQAAPADPGDASSPPRGRHRLYVFSVALFLVASVGFGLSSEPLLNPLFIGHQARELVTHATVTLPLSLAACFAIVRPEGRAPRWKDLRFELGAGVVAILIGTYLGIGTLLSDAHSHAQSDSLISLVLVHWFEHFLGYFVVPATAVLALTWGGAPVADRGPAEHRP